VPDQSSFLFRNNSLPQLLT